MKRIHYAWVILAVSFIGVLAAQGVRYSFGAFMDPWEQDFASSRGTVSAISFLSFIVFALSQPIVGKLIDRFGIKLIFLVSMIILGVATILSFFATTIWQMFFLYGIISSLGFGGASGVTATVAVTKWFHKRQGLALGIVEAGFGAGQMLLVPSSLLLISQFGWRITVLLLGGFLIVIVCPILAFFLKSEPSKLGIKAWGQEDEGGKPETKDIPIKKVTGRDLLLNRGFWFLIIPFFVCGFTTTGLMDTHLIPFAQYCGFSVSTTSAAVSLLAAFNTAGTLATGILADRWNNSRLLAYIYLIRGFTLAFLVVMTSNHGLMSIFLEHPWLLVLFSISFGLVDFSVVAPTLKLLTSYFPTGTIGVVTGLLYMSHQLGSALGSYLPGILFDTTNSYQITFEISFVLLIIASILSMYFPKTNTYKKLIWEWN